MFRFLFDKFSFWFAKKQLPGDLHPHGDKKQINRLSDELAENLKLIRQSVGGSSDVIIREFAFGPKRSVSAALIFVDGLSNTEIIDRCIIEPLMYDAKFSEPEKDSDFIGEIERNMLSVSETNEADTVDGVIEGFLAGDASLLVDGADRAIIISCKGWEKRSISEPSSESVIRGPRESFTENIRTNTSMLRRKIKNPALTLEPMKLGRQTRTVICIAYVRGLADDSLLKTVRQRLQGIDVDSILESGYIEQYIEDAPFSLFATVGNSEKPDVVAANLLEGRAAILVDGSPVTLIVPYLFVQSFQTAEDYYSRPYYMTMLRLVRYAAFAITTLAPSIYVAITTYHQELIPTELLFSMATAREGIPFPAFLESFIMLLTFEILREAGVRLPRPVGQAMSIVGALVIGQASVSAGLIGAPMVIVVAITAVSIFVVPALADSIAILRLIYLILAAAMGGFGITMGILGTLVHLASLESFGVPYLSPFVPLNLSGHKDAFLRAPLWMMLSRPSGLSARNRRRRSYVVPPTGSGQNSGSDGGAL